VRALFAFLVLAAAAVAVALLARINHGYALFVAPPYRIELSLNAFFVLAVVGLVAFYALLRIGARLSNLPEVVRESRRRRQVERARRREDAAIVALIEGRNGKARQFADEALAIPGSSPVSALIAARAALDTRDFAAVFFPALSTILSIFSNFHSKSSHAISPLPAKEVSEIKRASRFIGCSCGV
jgi:HemY protein